MNRTNLEQAVYRDFGYADSPATAVTNRIRGYLNDRHRRLCSLPGMERYRFQTQNVSTVASTATYSLDAPIAKILKITDTTADEPLYERSLDWWRQMEPDTTNSSGNPQYYVHLGVTPALRNIGGTGLWVVSTSATDAGGAAVTVHVETIDSNGSLIDATAATNGLTRVQIGTATNHQRLLRFAGSAAAVGVLELYDAAAAGNKVSAIEIGRTNAQFVRIGLWPAPSAVNTLQVDYIHHIRDFSQNYDEPQLPLDFHYLVALGAKIDEARHKDDTRVGDWQNEWNLGIRNLLAFHVGPDTIFLPGRLDEDSAHGSNLGSYFPAGRW